MEGHTGRMTRWELMISLVLVVFFNMIKLSQGNCGNYFNLQKWGKDLELQVPLIKKDNLKATMKCSANMACSENRNSTPCKLADMCKLTQVPGDCHGESLGTIPFYLFMCLMAESLGMMDIPDIPDVPDVPDVPDIRKYCKNVTECMLNRVIVFDQTPLPSTPTLSKTTAVPTTETPTTTAAALPANPSAVLQSSAGTKNSTGAGPTISNAVSGQEMKTENLTLKMFLLVSVAINVVLVVLKLTQMWQNNRRKYSASCKMDEISETQSLRPNNCHITPGPDAVGNTE